jgi:hypothetical protein
MAELIWFFGASGSGKATLIRKVKSKEFVLPDITDSIKICEESLQFERHQRRTCLLSVLRKYALKDKSILIKGQGIDLSELHLPYVLCEQVPSLRQKVVFVHTEPRVLPERTAKRRDAYWPNPAHDFIEETIYQIMATGALCEFLDITPLVVNNSAPEPLFQPNVALNSLLPGV